MSSFFEKLKKGMGIEAPEEPEKKEWEEKPKPVLEKKKVKKTKMEAKLGKPARQNFTSQNLGGQAIKEAEEKKEPEIKEEEKIEVKKEKWFEPEGELAIDVYQTEEELVIQSAIAGVKPEDLDISIENDQVLIRGSREQPIEERERNYFYQECYWGPFSRQIILPEEVDPSRAQAIIKEGILTIRIPKIERKKKRKILVKKEV